MLVPTPKNCDPSVRQAIAKLASLKLGPTSEPTFAGLTLTDPLAVSEGGTGVATLTDHGILLGSGIGAITPLGVATHGQIPIGSTGADPVLAAITGTANQIIVTNAAGSITLSLPQDYDAGATPTLGGLTLTGCSVLGLNSAVFQPDTDSTTFFQVLDANGGTPILNIDATNERVGIGTASPSRQLHVAGSGTSSIRLSDTGAGNNTQVNAIIECYRGLATSRVGWMGFGSSSTDNLSMTNLITGGDIILMPTATGKVGIGTATPGAKLHIAKSLGTPTDLGDYNNYQLVIEGGVGMGNTAAILLSSDITSYGGSAIVHYDTGAGGIGDLVFYTKQSIAAEPPVEVMRLDDTGNVGIGADNPATKLDVNGIITATGLTLTGDILLPEAGKIYTVGEYEMSIESGYDLLLKSTSAGDIDIESADDIFLDAGDVIHIRPSNDYQQYVTFSTTDNVPEIGTAGTCNLKITASGGTIDFDNEILKTTGNLTDGTNSLTIAEAKAAHTHISADGSSHADVVTNSAYTAVGHLPLAGGTLTGNLLMGGAANKVPFIIEAVMTGGATVTVYNANAPIAFRVTLVWVVETSTDIGAVHVTDGANSITGIINMTSDEMVRVGMVLDDAFWDIAVNGSLEVVCLDKTPILDAVVYIMCLPT